MSNKIVIPEERIVSKIIVLRDEKVILDVHLADLYGVETRVLKQAVQRNIGRFPEDFMFELGENETLEVVSQNVIPSNMQIQFRIILLLLLFAVCNSFGQGNAKPADSSFGARFKKQMQAFKDSKTGNTFEPVEEWQCIDGSWFDLNKVNTPSMIFFGQENCAPCRFELPLMVKTASAKKYGTFNFIYISCDDTADIRKELTNGNITTDKLKIVALSQNYIRANNLIMGYPTVYFLNSDKTVNLVESGGRTDDEERVKKEWCTDLDALK